MPKRSSNKKSVEKINFSLPNIKAETNESVPQHEVAKNPAAVALGRLGGLKGGKARAEKLTPEQRKEIALKAAQTRWQK